MDWSGIASLTRVQFYTLTSLAVVFLIIGFFGNIISIIIFCDKEFIKQPAIVYLNSANVMNIITLLYAFVFFLSPKLIINDFNCKVIFGTYVVLLEYQAWIIALGSFDRLVSILKPNKYFCKNKFQFQMITMIITLVFIIIFVLPSIYFYTEGKTINNITTCSFPIDDDYLWVTTYFKVEYTLFRAVIPFLIMIISSLAISWNVFKMKRRVGAINSIRQKQVNLFKAMVFLDLFFIIFRIPMLVYLLMKNDGEQVTDFTYGICVAIGFITNTYNFVLWIIFNKVYKSLFKKYAMCKCKQSNLTAVQPS